MAHAAVSLPAFRNAVLDFPAMPRITRAAATAFLDKFALRSPLPAGALRSQLIAEATWKRTGKLLGPTAAQTVTRLRHALAFATRTWQSEAAAIDWLLTPHAELDNATPYSLLRTENGGRAVDSLMAALEFGFPV